MNLCASRTRFLIQCMKTKLTSTSTPSATWKVPQATSTKSASIHTHPSPHDDWLTVRGLIEAPPYSEIASKESVTGKHHAAHQSVLPEPRCQRQFANRSSDDREPFARQAPVLKDESIPHRSTLQRPLISASRSQRDRGFRIIRLRRDRNEPSPLHSIKRYVKLMAGESVRITNIHV